MQRLGKNRGGYFGETVAVESMLRELQAEALKHGWTSDCFLTEEPYCLRAYHRVGPKARKRIYLSTGIHGDEPAGPLAVLELVRANQWPEELEVWLCPCLNPTGFSLNRRENAQGLDLNRDYRHLHTAEVRAHVGWLEKLPRFDLTLILHEDWEANGFYLYELNWEGLPSAAERIIEAVRQVCPIEPGITVDGWPAAQGIIRPQIHPRDRAQWPEAVYLISYKTRQSYTLEAPSDFPLQVRVNALKTGVQTAAHWLVET